MYDVETAVNQIKALYQAKLNDVITCINTEKNDDIVLETIPNDLYIFEVITEDMLNYDVPFIMYAVQPAESSSPQSNNFLKRVPITFTISIPDCGNANRDDEFYKLLRYQRALETVIIKDFDIFQGHTNPSVTSLAPDAFEYNGKVFINIGVEISLTITAR